MNNDLQWNVNIFNAHIIYLVGDIDCSGCDNEIDYNKQAISLGLSTTNEYLMSAFIHIINKWLEQ